jgi:hypothetical protein
MEHSGTAGAIQRNMKSFKIIFLSYSLIPCLYLTGCVSFFDSSGPVHESSPLKIMTFDLFHQRPNPNSKTSTNYVGDWIYRRERLSLVDQEIRLLGLDLIAFQNLTSRSGSPSESDKSILSKGALKGFSWQGFVQNYHDDTAEQNELSLAVAPPLKLRNQTQNKKPFWVIGNEGAISAYVVERDRAPFAIFNIIMPARFGRNFIWYSFIEEKIKDFLKQNGICKQRMIILGYLPADEGSVRFREFSERLELKDSATGFCKVASKCNTADADNELLLANTPELADTITDRILIHSSAIVLTSRRVLAEPQENSNYHRQLGLSQKWPSIRSGWLTSVRLNRCP